MRTDKEHIERIEKFGADLEVCPEFMELYEDDIRYLLCYIKELEEEIKTIETQPDKDN